VYFLGVKAANA